MALAHGDAAANGDGVGVVDNPVHDGIGNGAVLVQQPSVLPTRCLVSCKRSGRYSVYCLQGFAALESLGSQRWP